MARANSHEQELAPQGWEERSVPQGRPIPVRETGGERRQVWAHRSRDLHHRDTMKLRRERVFVAASGPLSMLPPGKTWYLGMSHPGTAGSGEARSWRGDVVRLGAGAILNNMAQSSRGIYPTELKERHCHYLPALWEHEWWFHMRAELVVWETSGGWRY